MLRCVAWLDDVKNVDRASVSRLVDVLVVVVELLEELKVPLLDVVIEYAVKEWRCMVTLMVSADEYCLEKRTVRHDGHPKWLKNVKMKKMRRVVQWPNKVS